MIRKRSNMLSLFLAIALIFTMIGPSYAAVTDIVVQGAAGDTNLYQYDYAELNASYMNYLMGDTAGASLYLDFMNKTYPPVAFKDSEKGYVDYNDVSNAYMNALMSGSDWNTDNYTSTLAAPADMPPTVKATSVIGGEITTVDTPTSTTAITITAVTAIDPKTVDVGTGFKSLGLPTTNKVTYSDGTTADLAISEWGGDKYEKDIAGVYNLLAVLTLPTGVTYGEGVTGPTCKVTVVDSQAAIVAAAEGAVAAYEAAAITTAEEITAAEALEVTANEKAALVADADKKAAFEARIAAKKAAVDAAKAALVKLVVSSVSAINLKEVTVVFNNTVDKTTAETASNYTMSGNSFTPVLGADKKTVTLFATNTMTNNAQGTLTIKNVKNEAGDQTVADTTKTFTASDTTIPTVVSVEAMSNKIFKVTFSEPIQTAPVAASYKIAGETTAGAAYGPFAVAAVSKTNNKVFTVTTTNPIPAGTVEIEVNINGTINDYAGYIVPTVKQNVTITADTTAPQADSVTVNSQTEVLVTFNKEVAEATVTAAQANFKWNTTNTTVGAKAAATATKVTATTYKVTFAGANAMTAGERFFFVPAGITDLAGNAVAAKSFPITVAADTAPEVTSVTIPSANVIQINFNKAMDATSVQTRANYVLKDSQGTKVTTAGTLTYDSTNKLVVWALGAGALADTQYTLTMTNLKDNILQTMAETTKTFSNVPSAAPTRVDSARLLDDADGLNKDVVILPFDLPVATSGEYSALNAAKWTASGTALKTAYANATLSINPNDPKEVRIHLGANIDTGTPYNVFAVNNIASNFGAIQTTLQTYAAVTTAQAGLDLSAGATSIKLLDNKTFELKVNRKLSAVDPGEFAVMEGATDITTTKTANNAINPIASAAFTNTATGATITLTMTNALNTTVNYQLATKAAVTVTKDLDGIAFQASKQFATNATLDFGANITGAYMLDKQYVVLKADQTVSTLVSASDFIVKIDGVTKAVLGANDGTTLGVPRTANEIRLDMGATNVPVTSAVTVQTVAQEFIQTEATNGKKLAAFADPITATNFRAQSLTLGNGNVTLAVYDTITIVFNNAIDPTSVGFVAGNKLGDNSYVRDDASLVFATSNGADDTITITMNAKNIARIDVNDSSDNVLTDGTATAEATLSADGKTLAFKLTALGTAGFDNSKYVKAALTLAPAVSDVIDSNKNAPNSAVTPQTTTKF